MKRNEIVALLIGEGFTSKTLLKMDDKQLGLLSSRIIKEQVEQTTMISKKSPTYQKDVENAKKVNKTIETYEQKECTKCKKTEMKEENSAGDSDGNSFTLKNKVKNGVTLKGGSGKKEVSKTDFKFKKIKKEGTIKNKKPSNKTKINEWVDSLVSENYHTTSKGEIMSIIKQKLNEQQLEKSKLPLDTSDTVYADAVSPDQSTAQKIANSNARAKFMGKFPNKHFIKIVETAHKTEDGDYRYVVGLKLKQEANDQDQQNDSTQNNPQQNEIKEQETMTPMPSSKPKKGHNGIPEWLKYDAIKANSSSPSIAPVKTPTRTKPSEKPRPKNPYQPGPGINPTPKAKH